MGDAVFGGRGRIAALRIVARSWCSVVAWSRSSLVTWSWRVTVSALLLIGRSWLLTVTSGVALGADLKHSWTEKSCLNTYVAFVIVLDLACINDKAEDVVLKWERLEVFQRCLPLRHCGSGERTICSRFGNRVQSGLRCASTLNAAPPVWHNRASLAFRSLLLGCIRPEN